MYSEFERELEDLASGIEMPPPTDMNGKITSDYNQNQMSIIRNWHRGIRSIQKQSEQAIVALIETRDDLINDYIDMSQLRRQPRP